MLSLSWSPGTIDKCDILGSIAELPPPIQLAYAAIHYVLGKYKEGALYIYTIYSSLRLSHRFPKEHVSFRQGRVLR